jgi:hypothetical protein
LLYHPHFSDRRKERRLLSAGSFFVTFATVRGITHAIRAERGPFRNITPGGRHIHHMTFGIIGLLTVGYLWMLEIGTNDQRRASLATSIVYGSGAALTLDEFALWAQSRRRLLDQAGPGEHRRRGAVRLGAVYERDRPGLLERPRGTRSRAA